MSKVTPINSQQTQQSDCLLTESVNNVNTKSPFKRLSPSKDNNKSSAQKLKDSKTQLRQSLQELGSASEKIQYSIKLKDTLPMENDTYTLQQRAYKRKQSILKWNNVTSKMSTIQRFFEKLINQSAVINFGRAKKEHISLIEDIVFFDKMDDGKQQFVLSILELMRRQMQKIGVFNQQNIFLKIWKVIFICVMIVLQISMPIKRAYSLDFEENQLVYTLLIWIPIQFSIVDILLNCNTSIYDEGLIINDRMKILVKYGSREGLIDFLGLIHIIFQDQMHIFLTICFFMVRTYGIFYYKVKDIDDSFQLSQRLHSVWSLCLLIIKIMIMANFFGCGFFMVSRADVSNGIQGTWLNKQGLHDAAWYEQYLNSVYYIFITMITVGYGDITPISINEKLFAILITIISSGQFAYTVNTVGNIFNEISQRAAKQSQQKYEVSKYMRVRNIDLNTQLKVMKYLDYVQAKEENSPEKALQILNQVSYSLVNDIYSDYYGKIVKKSKVLSLNFSAEFLTALALKMKETIYGPGETIFVKNENDKKIYFLVKGTVELYLENNRQSRESQSDQIFLINRKEIGETFGHHEFFSGNCRKYHARSKNLSTVVYINQENFMDVARSFPQDYVNYFVYNIYNQLNILKHKFCQMRDEYLFYFKSPFDRCLPCEKYGHAILNCPLVHYEKKKTFSIEKMKYSQFQMREKRFQRVKKKMSALRKNKVVKESLVKIRTDFVKVAKSTAIQQFLQDDQSANSSIISDIQQEEKVVHLNDMQFFQDTERIAFKDGKWFIINDEEDEINDSDCDSDCQPEHTDQATPLCKLQQPNEGSNAENQLPQIQKKRNNTSKLQQIVKLCPPQMNNKDQKSSAQIFNLPPLFNKPNMQLADKLQIHQLGDSFLDFSPLGTIRKSETIEKQVSNGYKTQVEVYERVGELRLSKPPTVVIPNKSQAVIQGHQEQIVELGKQLEQQNISNENSHEIFLLEFDVMKEYKTYYPHNNASVICRKKNISLKRSQEKKKSVLSVTRKQHNVMTMIKAQNKMFFKKK